MFNIREYLELDRNGRAYCPSCELSKGRRPSQKSLAVLANGAYKCHAGCSIEEIRASLGVPKTRLPDALPPEPTNLYSFDQVMRSMNLLLNGKDEESKWSRQWLEQRGITPEIIHHYRLGLNRCRGTAGISIPIPADDHSLSYHQKIRLEPWIGNKSWSQKGIPSTVYFTHHPEQAKQTYLCEGEWDAILLGWAIREVQDTAIATFTCGCSSVPSFEQMERLPGNVFIFYDRDEPGAKGADKVARALSERGWIAQVPCKTEPAPKGWDISDAMNTGLTVKDIQETARQAVRSPFLSDTKKLKLTYEQCMGRIEDILQTEDTARQLWELSWLAKEAEMPLNQLRKIHHQRSACSRAFEPLDVVDFLAKAPESREWVIAGKIPRGSTIALIADGGTGKSRLSYDLAYAVAAGKPWNGFRTMQGKVLIIQTDEPDVDFSDSLKDARYDELERGVVQVETEWQFSQIPQLKRWVEQEQPLLVIIDSFTSSNRASELDEKDTNYGACIYDLRNIANTYGCTFIILHHTNKLGESRGTTAIPDNVSEVWYLRRPKSDDNLPKDQRIWTIDKSRSRCSGKFAISYDPDECVVAYHGEHNATPDGRGDLEARLLEHFQRSPMIPFEVEELALQFSSSESHIRRLVKRLWRQGHIAEERREISINGSKGGITRKKVYFCEHITDDQVLQTQSYQALEAPDHNSAHDDQVLQIQSQQASEAPDHSIPGTGDTSFRSCVRHSDDKVLQTQTEQGTEAPDRDLPEDDQVLPAQVQQGLKAPDHSVPVTSDTSSRFCVPNSNDQVTKTQAGQGALSPDHELPKDDQVTKSLLNQGSLSPDHQTAHTDRSATASASLQLGDRVELLTGYFAGRHVEVVGFSADEPGWIEVRGKDWLVTHKYQRSDLRLLSKT